MRKNIGSSIVRLVPILLFFAAWEAASRSGFVNPRLFPPPSQAWRSLIEWANSGQFFRDVAASLFRAVVGLVAGGTLGVLGGMATGRSRIANAAFSPLIEILRPLPPVAIIPLVIVWLGIGNLAKIFSISFAVFFPVWLNTHAGAALIAEPYLWSARVLCKSRTRIFFLILLPATLPWIIAGVRSGIAVAFVMVFVSEIAGASSGIGYQISVSHLAYRIDMMMAALATLALAGALTDRVFSLGAHWAFPWLEEGPSK